MALADPGFPSGRTMMATIVYGFITINLMARIGPWPVRFSMAIATIALVLLVALSRMYLGEHYLSDVLGAMAAGMAWLALYTVFLLGLKRSAPGYIEQVWNLEALSGVQIYGLPLEELLFGFSFGLVWSGIYEHFTWKRCVVE